MKEISINELESRFNLQVELFVHEAESFSKEGKYQALSYVTDEICKILDVFFTFRFIDFETYNCVSDIIRKSGRRIWKEYHS